MRALTTLGVFSESPPDFFGLTPTGRLLASEQVSSFRPLALFMTGPPRWRCWGDLLDSVRTGGPAAERVLGMPIFEYYAAQPEESRIHDQALAAISEVHSAAIVKAYDFTRFRRVVDVGGGSGRLLAAILNAVSGAEGVLFDLPHVAGEMPAVFVQHGVADRCRVATGSFFDAVPGGGDAYLLKLVLHDWDDDRASAILATCRRAMGADSTLLIFERVLPERAEHGQAEGAFLLDLEMLVMTPGGRERTQAEFGRLLATTGFVIERVVETVGPLSIIEGRPL